MTPQERDLLTRFLDDLAAARGAAKDGEADAMIARALGQNPDAGYLLVQHAIVADQALHAAQARIAELEAQLPAPQAASAPSFLPSAGPWGRGPSPSAAGVPSSGGAGVFGGGGGLGSFLRSAGTTAAGAAGGALMFEGLSNLFGGGGHGWSGGSGFLGQVPENITINDYGDDRGGGDSFFDDSGSDPGNGGDWS